MSPGRFEPVISAGERPQTIIKIARNKLSVGAYPLANFSSIVAERPQLADSHSVHFLFSVTARYTKFLGCLTKYDD